MKVSIHNYLTEQQEIISIPADTKDKEIETVLSKMGYSIGNIEYMVLKEEPFTGEF